MDGLCYYRESSCAPFFLTTPPYSVMSGNFRLTFGQLLTVAKTKHPPIFAISILERSVLSAVSISPNATHALIIGLRGTKCRGATGIFISALAAVGHVPTSKTDQSSLVVLDAVRLSHCCPFTLLFGYSQTTYLELVILHQPSTRCRFYRSCFHLASRS